MFSVRSELTLTTERTASSNQDHMSDQMRRRTIAFWVLLVFSAFQFAIAAPVAVGEILEVRSNMGVLKDGIAAWEKRVDSGEYHSMGSDSDSGLTDTPGDYTEEDMELDAREKEPSDYDLIVNYDTDADNGADDADNNIGADGYEADSDVSADDSSDADSDTDSNTVSDVSDDDVHGEHPSVENMSPSPEPEHPATPEHMTDLESLSYFLGHRPRNSASGAVGTPKMEFQGIGDTKTYLSGSSLPVSVVKARVAAASSILGGDLVRSMHDLPVHSQNRKKWTLDQLD